MTLTGKICGMIGSVLGLIMSLFLVARFVMARLAGI
jgi:hypothetical protein